MNLQTKITKLEQSLGRDLTRSCRHDEIDSSLFDESPAGGGRHWIRCRRCGADLTLKDLVLAASRSAGQTQEEGN